MRFSIKYKNNIEKTTLNKHYELLNAQLFKFEIKVVSEIL